MPPSGRNSPCPTAAWRRVPPLSGLAQPSVAVEFATISNPVEEGWLRSSTFLKRTAVAVANGLKDYFAGEGSLRIIA